MPIFQISISNKPENVQLLKALKLLNQSRGLLCQLTVKLWKDNLPEMMKEAKEKTKDYMKSLDVDIKPDAPDDGKMKALDTIKERYKTRMARSTPTNKQNADWIKIQAKKFNVTVQEIKAMLEREGDHQ